MVLCVPEGRRGNSPAIYRWGLGDVQPPGSPVGTIELGEFGGGVQPSLRDLRELAATANPAINRWAIFNRP